MASIALTFIHAWMLHDAGVWAMLAIALTSFIMACQLHK
jgi:hypothetical protein